jgi:hypothetical protein
MVGSSLAAHAASRGLLRLLMAALLCASVAPAQVFAAGNAVGEAAGVAKQAMDYYKAGEFPMAAELYRRAFRLDPTRPEYLFGLGRSLQNAKQYKEAMLAYESLLALLPATDPWSKKGRHAVQELQATMTALEKTAAKKPPEEKSEPPAQPKPVSPQEPVKVIVEVRQVPAEAPKPAPAVLAPTPTVTPVAVAPAMPQIDKPAESERPAWHKWTQWGLIGGGAAALVAGVAVYGAAVGQRSALDTKLAQTQSGLISGIGYSDATAQAEAIGHQKTIGAVTMGIGAAAAVAGGIFLLLDRPSTTAWLPTPASNGVQWAGRF